MGKTVGEKTAGRRKPPFETLDRSEVVDRARALLRSGPTLAEADKWARRLTRFEDWLEMEHPHDDRAALRDLRRRFEDLLS